VLARLYERPTPPESKLLIIDKNITSWHTEGRAAAHRAAVDKVKAHGEATSVDC
jgi:hypothetical protein